MIGSVTDRHRLTGVETALRLLAPLTVQDIAIDHQVTSINSAPFSVKIPSHTSDTLLRLQERISGQMGSGNVTYNYGGGRYILTNNDTRKCLSKIEELIAGKIKFHYDDTGSYYDDLLFGLNDAFYEGATICEDGSLIANKFGLSDENLKELGRQVMKSHISQGFLDEQPGLKEAVKFGRCEIVLADEVATSALFMQGKFKKISDSYGFFSDHTPSSKADREFRDSFYASDKRFSEFNIGAMRFGIVYW